MGCSSIKYDRYLELINKAADHLEITSATYKVEILLFSLAGTRIIKRLIDGISSKQIDNL